jgi:Ca2+-binding RTX toxin-like protein
MRAGGAAGDAGVSRERARVPELLPAHDQALTNREDNQMVKFVAYKSQDNADLSEIGLFQNIKKNLTRKGEGKKFDATKGDIDMHVTGKAMLFVLKNPVSGTMKTIDVKVGGTDEYELKGLDIKIRKMKDFFKGNYESKIFEGKDTINGSSQSDKLSGFAGDDTISGGNGGDTILGDNGNDSLYGEGGADTIKGGKGNDLLDGGSGFNSLTGNAGKDTFHFSTQLNASNSSAITDFTASQGDIIQLVKSVFPDLSGKGVLQPGNFVKSADYAGQDGVVVYDKASGVLQFATSSNVLVKFGEVTANLDLKASDFFVV